MLHPHDQIVMSMRAMNRIAGHKPSVRTTMWSQSGRAEQAALGRVDVERLLPRATCRHSKKPFAGAMQRRRRKAARNDGLLTRAAGLYTAHERMDVLAPKHDSDLARSMMDECARLAGTD